MSTSQEGGEVPLEIKTPMGFTQPCRSQLSHPVCKLTTAVQVSHERKISPSAPWERGSQVGMFPPKGAGGVPACSVPQGRSCLPCESPMHCGRRSDAEVLLMFGVQLLGKILMVSIGIFSFLSLSVGRRGNLLIPQIFTESALHARCW